MLNKILMWILKYAIKHLKMHLLYEKKCSGQCLCSECQNKTCDRYDMNMNVSEALEVLQEAAEYKIEHND